MTVASVIAGFALAGAIVYSNFLPEDQKGSVVPTAGQADLQRALDKAGAAKAGN